MRTIHTKEIVLAVKKLCIQANMNLPKDLTDLLITAQQQEPFPLAQSVLGDLVENLTCAKQLGIPICQDTGMAIVFIEMGQEVHLEGGLLQEAINQGVAEGYREGHLRCSIVSDPLKRDNTQDNTPAIVYIKMVDGDRLKITVAPKGFGSENMSSIQMFTPAATQQDIIEYVLDRVEQAGSKPCPPIVVGLGIGGDFEYCAYLAKKAVCRSVSIRHPDPYYEKMEQCLLKKINQIGIGPQGFGGKTTALCVNIETYATHIAGLPVAINIGCHVTRHATVML